MFVKKLFSIGKSNHVVSIEKTEQMINFQLYPVFERIASFFDIM